jgi:hypothetical protein
MNNMTCFFPDRDAVLVAYLYDDIDAPDRVAFEAHLTTCLLCRSDLAELRGVRETLGRWVPPEPARAFSHQSTATGHQSWSPAPRAWWHTVPVWAQVAAAMLVFGVSLSIANLDVRYDRNGLNVRTGWSTSAPAPQAAPTDAAPWRGELTALQNQLRSELRAQATKVSSSTGPAAAPVAPAAGAMSDAELRRRVRVMLDESEKRQQSELALRLTQLQSDVYAQRQADLSKINQNIGFIQNTYGNTYGDLRNYVLRASQKQ